MKTPSRRQVEQLIVTSFYIGCISLGLWLCAEFAARALLDDTNVKIRFWEAGIQSEAYSYFDWRTQYFEDLHLPGGEVIYEPFSLWKHSNKKSPSFNVQNGYRITWEPQAARDKKDFIIFLLGGSTTYCKESPDNFTIASLLAKKLNGPHSNFRYLVRNYGVQAFLNDNEVHLLIKLLRSGHRPHAVLFYDGINDTGIKVGRGKTHYYEKEFRQNAFKPQWMSLKDLGRQIAFRSHLIWSFQNWRSQKEILPPLEDNHTKLRRNAEIMLRNYQENVRLVNALGKEYGFHTRFFWGPSLYNTKKALTQEERSRSIKPIFFQVVDIVKDTADKQGFFNTTNVIDIHHALDEVSQTVFVDSVHITPLGNEAVVQAMLPHINKILGPLEHAQF